MKLEMVCFQLCQGGVSAWCTDKPCMVDSVPDHVVVMAFQKHVAFIPVVVPEPACTAHGDHSASGNVTSTAARIAGVQSLLFLIASLTAF